MPENFTKKDIVNRGQLLAEYNDAMYVNEDGELILPSSISGSDRKPIPGHCLCFNSSNPGAYIQTSIPSKDRYNWRIIIKGEGNDNNYRTLYVDDSGTNIAIRQMSSAVEVDVFYLSYIAFVNITTNKVEHLFECEEGNGILLYDACTGDTATLENVTSISSLRVDSSTKEWIQSEDNLDNTYKLITGYGYAYGATATNFQTLPFPISIAFRFKAPSAPISASSNYEMIRYVNAGNYGPRITSLHTTRTYIGFYWLNGSAGSLSTNGVQVPNIRDYLCDNNWHTIVMCVNTSYIKVYIDGKLKATGNHTFAPITATLPTNANFYIDDITYSLTSHKDYSIKDLLIVNWDMSLENASYNIEDYEIKKDISTEALLGTSTDQVWLQWHNCSPTRLYDGSINKKHMTKPLGAGRDRLNTPSKCYGTFYNQVGGTVDNGIIIPRKVIS